MSSLYGKRIFIVEDNPANLAIMTILLQNAGATLKHDRWGGTQTLELMRNFRPLHVILLDLMLAGNMTGYDIFQLVRADDDLKSVPVVLITAADPDQEMEKARRMGFNGFISKPLRYNTFSRLVGQVADGEAVWAPLG